MRIPCSVWRPYRAIAVRIWPMIASGAAAVMSAAPAFAQAPGLYYAWRSIDGDMATCIDRSTTALRSQELTNIQAEGNSVAGVTENATAVFVCFDNPDTTTVMIMVASNDDETAFELREVLKSQF